MNIHKTLIACAIATTAGVALQARAAETADPVLASFDRAWNHPVAEAPAPTGRDAQADILYRLINRNLQSDGEARVTAATGTPVDGHASLATIVLAGGQ